MKSVILAVISVMLAAQAAQAGSAIAALGGMKAAAVESPEPAMTPAGTGMLKIKVLASEVFQNKLRELGAVYDSKKVVVQKVYEMGDGDTIFARYIFVVPLLKTSDMYFNKALVLRVLTDEYVGEDGELDPSDPAASDPVRVVKIEVVDF